MNKDERIREDIMMVISWVAWSFIALIIWLGLKSVSGYFFIMISMALASWFAGIIRRGDLDEYWKRFKEIESFT